MAGEIVMTVVGNLTKDPELKYSRDGAAVASFTVASTPRTFDKNTGSWRDGETVFIRVSAFRELAENVSNSLAKGSRVVVTGTWEASRYTDKDGQERTSQQLKADEIGASMKFATVKVTRPERDTPQPTRPAQQPVWSGDDASTPPF